MRQIIDLLGEQFDLFGKEPGDTRYAGRHCVARLSERPGDSLEVGGTLRKDEAELRQMAAQCIDQLCALPNEALMGPEGHCPCLMLGALHGHIVNVREQRRFGDRCSIGRVVLLPFEEGLHLDRRDQSNLVPKVLGISAPEVARGACIHRHDAPLLCPKQSCSSSDRGTVRLNGIALPGFVAHT